MNILARGKVSAHLIFPFPSLPKRSFYLHSLTTVAVEQCNSYSTKSTQKTQLTKPKTQKSSETFTQKVKKQVEELKTACPQPREIPYQAKVANFVNLIGNLKILIQFEIAADGSHLSTTVKKQVEELKTVSPKPREIPYQAKVANFVNLIGNVKIPIQFETAADGSHLATTVISQETENGKNLLLIPVVFYGDLAHIVSCHVKENDLVFISGRLSVDPMSLPLTESLGKFHLVAENINFLEGLKKSVPDKKINISFSAEAMKNEDVLDVKDGEEFNKQWKGALEDAKTKRVSSISVNDSAELSTDAEVEPRLASVENRNEKTKGRKVGEGASKKKNGDAILDLWRDLVKNPLQWWDYRGHKSNGFVNVKYPDFKQKSTNEALWVKSAPSWVLPGLGKSEFDVKVIRQTQGGAKEEYSWKDLVENPTNWWDNRSGKKFPKAPDFKHKETGDRLWLNDSPEWVLSKLPPVVDRQKMKLNVKNLPQTKSQGDEDSWKDVVENPNKWLDNRSGKSNPRAPDFKHKKTGVALWLNDAPNWVLSKLPPVVDCPGDGKKLPQKY